MKTVSLKLSVSNTRSCKMQRKARILKLILVTRFRDEIELNHRKRCCDVGANTLHIITCAAKVRKSGEQVEL